MHYRLFASPLCAHCAQRIRSWLSPCARLLGERRRVRKFRPNNIAKKRGLAKMPRRRGPNVEIAFFFRPDQALPDEMLAWRRVLHHARRGVHTYPRRTRSCAAHTGYPIHCGQWPHRGEAGKVVHTPMYMQFCILCSFSSSYAFHPN